MAARRSFGLLFYFIIFLLACLLVQARLGTLATDLGLTDDEGAHFVSSLLVLDYLRGLSFFHPMVFAIDYYEHFPRVAIGQWPPLFHLVDGVVLGIFGRSVAVALIFQAVIAAAVAALVARLVQQRQGFWVGLAAGALAWSSPAFLFLISAVMLDNFLALMILIAALCWARYARTRDWRWSAVFAVAASAAILTKGSAFGLALLPPLYAWLARDWRILASWKTWLAAVIVGCLAVPWYVLTYKIPAESFIYGWGWGYTRLAVPGYAELAASSLSIAGLAAFFIGAAVVVRGNRMRRDETLTTLVAVAVAVFLFQVIAPANIQLRYIIPMMPPAVVVAAYGVGAAVRWAADFSGRAMPATLMSSITAVMVAVIAVATFQTPHVLPLHMEALAHDVLAVGDGNPLVLVASTVRGEGALIAAFAAGDPKRTHYVIRGFKALASGNFNGTDYRSRFTSADDVAQWIKNNEIGWIIVDTSPGSVAWAHNRELLTLANASPADWQKRDVRGNPEGEIRLYRVSSAPAVPTRLEAVLRQIAPVKVIGQ